MVHVLKVSSLLKSSSPAGLVVLFSSLSLFEDNSSLAQRDLRDSPCQSAEDFSARLCSFIFLTGICRGNDKSKS